MAASGVPALAQGQALRPASRALPRPSTQHPAPSTEHPAPSTEHRDGMLIIAALYPRAEMGALRAQRASLINAGV